MNDKYKLPVLKKIRIENYDLYKCPFEIDLSKKLIVFFGTNGLGKTTLLNMIQYSVIGPYTGGVKTRNYKGKQKKRRPILSDQYFRNRIKDQTKDSYIISTFSIGTDNYIVKHSFITQTLLSFSVNSITIDGEITSYSKFEEEFFRTSEDLESSKLSGLLIAKYQKKLIESSCFPDFSSLITMMTNGMFFTEDRKYTFWDNELSNLIISKYFMDQNRYKDYESLSQNIKYLDSQSRLKTYELSFIKKFLGSTTNEKSDSAQQVDDISQIDDIKSDIQTANDELVVLQREVIENRQEYEKIHGAILNLDSRWYKLVLPDTYKESYNRYHRSIEMGICPICGQNNLFNHKVDECFVCGNHINILDNIDMDDIESEKHKLLDLIREVDNNYQGLLSQIQNKKNEIREMEKKSLKLIEKSNEYGKQNSLMSSLESRKIYEIELERSDLIHKLDDAKEKRRDIIKQIDEDIQLVFRDYAKLFNSYAGSFFGATNKSDIVLISDEGERFFRFVLGGIARESAYDLSESQRIFLDLSYRFSILSFFHMPSYFICETPDSTLDLNSEQNAVLTFKRYIMAGNKLIISANARNSELVEALVRECINDVEFIDLSVWSNLASKSLSFGNKIRILQILKNGGENNE